MSNCKNILTSVQSGQTVDDGVQRGEVQGTTCRQNKHNEGVYTMEGKILEKIHVKKGNRALPQIRRTISNKETDSHTPAYKHVLHT